ncbi:MAG: hypothetical protein H6597_06820 [Flavobacteriales bacterium]|nr:hypothetical protein [Flavobacteriales bacterium]
MPNPHLWKRMEEHWDPAWARERKLWVFYVVYNDLKKMAQLLEDLAPHGYRSERVNKRLRNGIQRTICITRLGQFTQQQMRAEMQRIQQACDRLGFYGLDEVDAEPLDLDRLHIN